MYLLWALIFQTCAVATRAWGPVDSSPTKTLHIQQPSTAQNRRVFLETGLMTMILFPKMACSQEEYVRQKDKIKWTIRLPPDFSETAKPVKTHLDEVNFISGSVKGYQYGVTVDPVRIDRLEQFGSPEEVAARVVTTEVNRDGVFEVKLVEDPFRSNDGAYVLEYLSMGKRGNKHLLNKIFVANNQLYVLTAQCKEDDYRTQKSELKQTMESFAV